MKIVKDCIKLDELTNMASKMFGDMVKAVVDIDQEIIALDAELHADLEGLLLNNDSKQENLWGINFYPELYGDQDFIEFDSMINIRPTQNNFTRGIDNIEIQKQILKISNDRVKE